MSYRSLTVGGVLVLVGLCAGLALWTAGETLPMVLPEARAQQAGDDTQVVSVTRVVDGDTIEVLPQVEGTEDVRLIGVNTPENRRP